MKYSVLKMEGTILTYRQAPDPMPYKDGGINSSKEFTFWQTNLNVYSIRPQDLSAFENFMQTATKGDDGILIPYELVDLFKAEDGITYARMNTNVVYDAEKGGIFALNHNCMVCGETWAVAIGTEKSPLPFCTSCTDSLKELILKNKNKESYGS